MSKLAEFRQLEQHLAEQLQMLEEMKSDKSLQQEMVFEEKLRALLGEYGKSLRDVILILDPSKLNRKQPVAAVAPVSRKPRAVKVYKNPHTGEFIETKGGNHKELKKWKSEYGSDTVESWVN